MTVLHAAGHYTGRGLTEGQILCGEEGRSFNKTTAGLIGGPFADRPKMRRAAKQSNRWRAAPPCRQGDCVSSRGRLQAPQGLRADSSMGEEPLCLSGP